MKAFEISVDGKLLCTAKIDSPSSLIAMLYDLRTTTKSKSMFFVKGLSFPLISSDEFTQNQFLNNVIGSSSKDQKNITWLEQSFKPGQIIHIKVVE